MDLGLVPRSATLPSAPDSVLCLSEPVSAAVRGGTATVQAHTVGEIHGDGEGKSRQVLIFPAAQPALKRTTISSQASLV